MEDEDNGGGRYGKDEQHVICFEDVEEITKESKTYCIMAKMRTTKSYSTRALMETMQKLWNPKDEMACGELGNNYILFEFNSRKDRHKVLNMAPWHFNKYVFVLKEVDDEAQPSSLKFHESPFRIRMYDIPMKGRNLKTVKALREWIGKVLEVDERTLRGAARSIRLKVMLNMETPLEKRNKDKVGDLRSKTDTNHI